jgi:hypothetical protein
MVKKTVDTNKTGTVKEEMVSQSRKPRKKVYTRVREGVIPDYVIEHFAEQGYALKPVRWTLQGIEEYRYLAGRENEGYEFVTADELPEQYLSSIRLEDVRGRKGLVTMGDLCLMKIDIDLQQSRIEAFQDDAAKELNAVDINTLRKKHGFKNLGTKSKVMLKAPDFAD